MRSRVIDDADMEGRSATAGEVCRVAEVDRSAGAVCDVCWPVSVVPGSAVPGGGAFRCVLRSTGKGCGRVEVWREYAETGVPVMLFAEPVDISITAGEGWMHLVACGHSERVLMALSIDGDGRMRYVSAPVLYEAGVAAGTCDAPVLHGATADFRLLAPR